MELLIVYKLEAKKSKELKKKYQESRFSLVFVETVFKFLSLIDSLEITNLNLYISHLSDISILRSVNSYRRDLKINLIISPGLYDNLILLKECRYMLADGIAETADNPCNSQKYKM